MKKFVLGLLLLLGLGHPALADATCSGGAISGMVIGGTIPACYYLKVNPDGSVSVSESAAAGASAVSGTQRGLSIASATALTVPTGATLAVIQAQGTNNSSGVCLYWQDDGTNPTASAGQQLAAQATLVYKITSLPIKLIAATGATCTATISYYQ